MNVDLPHPESAATPMTITFSSTPNTIDSWLPYEAERLLYPVMWDLEDPIEAKGAKPIALVRATKTKIARIMIKNMLIYDDYVESVAIEQGTSVAMNAAASFCCTSFQVAVKK